MVESNDTTNNETEEMEQDFESLFESSMQELHVGDVVRGTIVQVNDDNVVVDVGWQPEQRSSSRAAPCSSADTKDD